MLLKNKLTCEQPTIAPTTNPEQVQFLHFVGEIVKAITKKDTSDIESPPKFTGNDEDGKHGISNSVLIFKPKAGSPPLIIQWDRAHLDSILM